MANPPIRYVSDGEPIEESVIGRPINDIIENLQRLDDLISQSVENLDAGDFTSGVVSPALIPIATETENGIVIKARPEDIVSGSGSARYVTPAQVKAKVDEVSGVTGVALYGNPVIIAGFDETYHITNFDSFSDYEVSVDVGSVTMVDDYITVAIPSGSTGEVTLDVSKDGRVYSFAISISESAVVRPTIVIPSEGSDTFSIVGVAYGSEFATIPPGVDTHASTDWQIATDPGFTNIVYSVMGSSTNLTTLTVPPSTLSIGTQYFIRVRYHAHNILSSPWSQTRSFYTASRPDTPTISYPTAGATNIQEQPSFTSSSFSSPVTEDHESSDWEVRKVSDNSLVWSSTNNTVGKTTVGMPAGHLQVSTEYKVRVRHRGSVLGLSNWSPYINFTTADTFFQFIPENAGAPFGGGYYAGGNIIIDGLLYALIVAPKTTGETSIRIRTSESVTIPDLSTVDGKANTELMLGVGGYPAATWVSGLTIGGHEDWYIPSIHEMEIIYRYLKPDNTKNSTSSSSLGRVNNQYSVPPGFNYTATNPSYSENPYHSAFRNHAFSVSSSGPTSEGSWTVDSHDYFTYDEAVSTYCGWATRHSVWYRSRYVSSTTNVVNYWTSSRVGNYFAAYSFGDGSQKTHLGTASSSSSSSGPSSSTKKWCQSAPIHSAYEYHDTTNYYTNTNTSYVVRAVRRHLIGPV